MSSRSASAAFQRFQDTRQECEQCGPYAECSRCRSSLLEYLQERMNEMVGTKDLEEANRRAAIVEAWRTGDD